MSASRTNIGAEIKGVACGLATATAGGTGDNTAVTGATIDRTGFDSCQVTVGYKTSLGASETLAVALELQESSDGVSWDTAEAIYTSTVVRTGSVTDGVGAKRSNISFAGRKQYIRFNFTPNLSRANTDTAVVACVASLGGAANLPVDIS